MNSGINRRTLLLALLLTLVIVAPVAAQKHIVAAADKIRNSGDTGGSVSNVVRRSQDSRCVISKLLCAEELAPKYMRALVRAVELDEDEAYENNRRVENGECSQILKFYDGKSHVSVVINYRVKDYRNASVVVREDFTKPDKNKGKVRSRRMSCNPRLLDLNELENLRKLDLNELENLRELNQLPESLKRLGDDLETIYVSPDDLIIFNL